MITLLPSAVPFIKREQKRLIRENLLRLNRTDAVFVLTLPGIPLVPVEPLDLRQVDHIVYMPDIYKARQFPMRPA